MHVGWGRAWLRVGVAEREVSEHGYFFLFERRWSIR